MMRLSAAVRTVLALSLALLLVLPVANAREVEQGFKEFEAPRGERVRGRCKSPAVRAHRAQLIAAVSLLGRKIDRIVKAKADAIAAMATEEDLKGELADDSIWLNLWEQHWRRYKAELEAQIAFYSSLPDCPSRDRPSMQWTKASVRLPRSSYFARTTVCANPTGTAEATPYVEANRKLLAEHRGLMKSVREWVSELRTLTAQGSGDGARARDLKRQIDEAFAKAAKIQFELGRNDTVIYRMEQVYPCPPPPPPEQPSTAPPPADARQSAAPLGQFETGVLALLDSARSSPPAYAESLRGARGTAAREARDFLRARTPLPALARDPQLIAAAQGHAEDLARRNVISHTGGDGAGLLVRFRRQGLQVTLAAEVISTGQSTPAGVIRQLIIDEGHPGGPHRKDLFNPVFTRIGVAVVRTRSHGQVCVITLSNEPMRRDE